MRTCKEIAARSSSYQVLGHSGSWSSGIHCVGIDFRRQKPVGSFKYHEDDSVIMDSSLYL